MANSASLPQRVVEAFGGLVKTHKATGIPVSTIGSWVSKGRIPHWRKREIREAAERQEVTLPDEIGESAA